MLLIRNIFLKITHALRGIRLVFKEELSFRLELLFGVAAVVYVYFLWPIELYSVFALLISYFLILSFELMNTSIETAMERLHPGQHDLIGKSKDIAAGAVLLSGVLFFLILAVITFF